MNRYPISNQTLSLLLLLCLSGCAPKPPATREVAIAAAADLKFALDEVSQEFAKQQSIHPKITYGSSGNFYTQLQNQAPFDLFLSADIDYPRKLSEQNLTLAGSEFTYAVGRIALWVPNTSPIDLNAGLKALAHPTVQHISIANPQHAPYGRAAEAAMRSQGVYDAAKTKLVLAENVAQALQFVQSGSAQIGIVALALAISPAVRDQGRYWEVPLDAYPRMDQGGVILKWAKDPDAARIFRTFLTSPAGRAILKRYGFSTME